MRFMLDTNIVSDMMRRPSGSIGTKIGAVGADAVMTSVIVAAELNYDVMRRGSQLLAERLEEALGAMSVMPFDPPVDQVYAEVRYELERQGAPIGNNDMLIAAHARSLGVWLVTDNMREFSRVRDLRVENWLRG
jgi:tRNA(fMet)-specific endonuclease VapC